MNMKKNGISPLNNPKKLLNNAEKNIIISQINDAISLLCEKNDVKRQEIGALTVCANTVMEHIFAGIDPKSISVYPFTSPTFFGEL